MKEYITAGQFAFSGAVNVETIRYYEKKGLLPEPKRNGSGYRIYDNESLQQLHFIKTSQQVGFTLEEIKELQQLSILEDEKCSDMHKRAEEKITVINSKLEELNKIKKALKKFSNRCSGPHSIEECHFIHFLWGIEGDCNDR